MKIKQICITSIMSSLILVFLSTAPTSLKAQRAAAPKVGSSIPTIKPEQAFFYYLAIGGIDQKPPKFSFADLVKIYGETFDSLNYRRSMLDEFERNTYWNHLVAKISDEANKANFNQKFSFVGWATLGEYSFPTKSFPIIAFQGIKTNVSQSLEINAYVRDLSVNEDDIQWGLPMSQNDASAFVKSRSNGDGVDRKVWVRVTYSIAKTVGVPISYADGIPWRPELHLFLFSVEVFNDAQLSMRLGVLPRTNPAAPNSQQEWYSAFVEAQTSAREIGRYSYIKEKYPNGNRTTGTIILMDDRIVFEPSNNQKMIFPFLDTTGAALSRGIKTYSGWRDNGKTIFVYWGNKTGRLANAIKVDSVESEFESVGERDRFFNDLKRTYQEWKRKYSPFQFAAGNFNVDERCKIDSSIVPCSPESVIGKRSPFFETKAYKVTVESFEKLGNRYNVLLAFENLTDKTIELAWEAKNALLPNASGPYLIDESAEKYFLEGVDSSNIMRNSMTLYGKQVELAPRAKLTSRLSFVGNGNGRVFTLKAEEIQGLRTTQVSIEGLELND